MVTKKKIFLASALVFAAVCAGQDVYAGQCRDPWVTQAIQQVKGRAPVDNNESGECNIRNFNNGSWGSYPELLGYVQRYFNARPSGAAVLNGARPSLGGGVNPAAALRGGSNPNAIVAGGGGNWGNKNNLIGDGGGT